MHEQPLALHRSSSSSVLPRSQMMLNQRDAGVLDVEDRDLRDGEVATVQVTDRGVPERLAEALVHLLGHVVDVLCALVVATARGQLRTSLNPIERSHEVRRAMAIDPVDVSHPMTLSARGAEALLDNPVGATSASSSWGESRLLTQLLAG